MKKLFLKTSILVLSQACLLANAQFRIQDRKENGEMTDQQKYSFGFYLNANVMDYKLTHDFANGMGENGNSLTQIKPNVSFGAGLMARMRLSEYFDLRLEPGLQFTQRNFAFNKARVLVNEADNNKPFSEDYYDKAVNRVVKATYLDVPLLLELHGDRWYNSRPYVAGGANWLVNLQSNAKSEQDNLEGIFRGVTHNFGLTAEIGVQLYFSRVKVTPAIRGTFGVNNELVADNPGTKMVWANTLSAIHTRSLMLMLKFE
jgi:Outer membrane protein beta-barrel domain